MALTGTALVRFLKEDLNLPGELDGDSALFSNGRLDSVSMVNLISFIEEAAGFQVRPDDVTLDNFDTPSQILCFVGSRG